MFPYLAVVWKLVILKAVALVVHSTLLFEGEIFKNVVDLKLFNNIKDFSDLKITGSPNETLEEFKQLKFNELPRRTKKEVLKKFILNHFRNESGIVHNFPTDWKPWPKLLERIKDKKVITLAKDLNKQWMKSSRELDEDVRSNPDKYSFALIPMPFFLGKANGREMDTWDSYWIFKGLLACGMHESAKNILVNLMTLVKRYGYLPKSNRLYDNKPVRPLLAPMVLDYVKAKWDEEFLMKYLELIDEEFLYWLVMRGAVLSNIAIDFAVVMGENKIPGRETYYRCVSREDSPPVKLTRVYWSLEGFMRRQRSRLVSVELCSLAEWSARSLAALYTVAGYDGTASSFINVSRALRRSIRVLLYSVQRRKWHDLDLENGAVEATWGWIHPRWTGTSKAELDPAWVLETYPSTPHEAGIIASALKNTSLGHEFASRYLSQLPETVSQVEAAVALHLLSLFPDVTLENNETQESKEQYIIPFLALPAVLLAFRLCATYKCHKMFI